MPSNAEHIALKRERDLLKKQVALLRGVIDEWIDFQVANRDTKGNCGFSSPPKEFYRCYTYPSGKLPPIVLKAKKALKDTTAIRALRNEGRSPWRKVGKKHPGKKWEGKLVIVAYKDGDKLEVSLCKTPKVYAWPHEVWVDYFPERVITHWQPWPEHPNAEKEVR